MARRRKDEEVKSPRYTSLRAEEADLQCVILNFPPLPAEAGSDEYTRLWSEKLTLINRLTEVRRQLGCYNLEVARKKKKPLPDKEKCLSILEGVRQTRMRRRAERLEAESDGRKSRWL